MGVETMLAMRRHKGWAVALVVVMVLMFAALAGFTGCRGADESVSTTAAGSYLRPTATTAAAATTVWRDAEEGGKAPSATPAYDSSNSFGTAVAMAGTLATMQAASGQKIIADAQLEIEVENGKFQTVFDQALLLAERYGGYLVSSNSYASGEENAMKSGTIAIRVPSSSFTQALSDAGKLGTLKTQTLSTQDVTEEYVDLQARIKNSEAHVNALVALLAKAKTIDEILQVQSTLTYAQEQLEQLKGRLRYLDEHTDYSTITMSIYEKGTEPVTSSSWGVGSAFKDALHYIVRVFNGIIRGLGVLIPVLIVLAIIAYVVYRIVIAVSRRNRQKQQALYQSQPQGWRPPMQAGPGPEQTTPATDATKDLHQG
jgi:uncharacterized membrane protein